jgi:Ca2+-dependent lipid-binding protein
LRALAEKKALDLQSKLTKVQDDLEQLQFAAATVAANTASRGGSLSSGSASVVNGQPVADVLWMNSTIAACWDGFLRNWLSSLAGNLLSDKLSTAKPSVLDSIHLASFEMKHKPPSCRNVRVLRSRKVFEGVMLELGVELSDISFNMTIHSKLAQLKIPLKLAVELDATNLLLRTSLLLIDRPPYAGSLKTSFADLPETKLKIIPEGVSGRMGNIAEFPGIDLWIKNSIQDALVKNLLEPNSYTWNIEDFFQQYYK